MASRLSWNEAARVDYSRMRNSVRQSVAMMHSDDWTPLTAAVSTILAIYEDATALVWDMRDIWKHSMSASTELCHLEAAFKECHAIVDAALLAGGKRFGCEFEFADNTTILELRHVTSYLDSRLLGPISRGPVSLDSGKRASLKATSALLQVAEEGCQQAVKCLRDLYIRLEEISSVIGPQTPSLERTASARAIESEPLGIHIPPRRRSSTESLSRALDSRESKRWARSDSLFDKQNQQVRRAIEEPLPLRTPMTIQVQPPTRSPTRRMHPDSLAALVESSLQIKNGDPRWPNDIGSPGPTVGGTLPSSPTAWSPMIPNKSPQRLAAQPALPAREQSWFSQATARSSSLASCCHSSLYPERSVSRSSSNLDIPPSLQLRRPGFSRPSSRSHRPSYDRPYSPLSSSQISAQSSVRTISAASGGPPLRRFPSDHRRPMYERRPFSFATEPLLENPTSPLSPTASEPQAHTVSAPQTVCNDTPGDKTPTITSTEIQMHATVGGPIDCWTPTFYSAPTYADSDSTAETPLSEGGSDTPWFDETVSDASSSTTDLHHSTSISSITTARSHVADSTSNDSPVMTRDPHSSLMPQERPRDPHSSLMPQEIIVTNPQNSSLIAMLREDSPGTPRSRGSPGTLKHRSPHEYESTLMVQELETPTFLPTPSPWNNYLGFCIGAFRAQAGSPEAMVKRQVMNVHHSKTTILKCSNAKCVFSGAGSDTKIWEAHNVRFRRPFLIKTHCAQKRVKKAMYTFQCPICVLLKMKSTIIMGTDKYIEHIATHRGQSMPIPLLERVRCIADRWADDGDEFDLNILPFDAKRPLPARPGAPPPTPNAPGRLTPSRQSTGVSELDGSGVERGLSPVSELSAV